MKTIEEYHRLAQEQMGKLVGEHGSYLITDLVQTTTQLMMIDAVEELTNAYPMNMFQFDAYGHLLVRTDHE